MLNIQRLLFLTTNASTISMKPLCPLYRLDQILSRRDRRRKIWTVMTEQFGLAVDSGYWSS